MAPLKSRLRESRLLQIAAVYAGAAWVVLEVTGTLAENLGLPAWVFAAALVLLLVGFFVVLATAWVQGRPGTSERAAAEEVPEAWELDPGDLARSFVRGRLPHLNWARAAAGGGIAFLLLFGFAGLYVVVQDRGRSFLPAEATAAAVPGIAIMPFSVTGDGLEIWREGMVDVLSTNLDGIGGLRAINSRTVLARWRESAAGDGPDLATTLDVARATGARLAVVGNAVRLGSGVRLSAELHDLESGRPIGTARVEGAQDSILVLVDRLSVDVVRRLLEDDRAAPGPVPATSAFATGSLSALQAFLEGEALYRRGDFPGAVRAYERAIAADSLFAMPYYRLSSAVGWTQGPGGLAAEYGGRARALADRLPARDAALLRASDLGLGEGDVSGIDELETMRNLYPDDPEVWYELGEAYNHLGDQALVPIREMAAAFGTAIRLDSAFVPAYIHAIEAELSYGDTARVRSLLDAFRRRSPPGSEDVARLEFMQRWLRGADVDRAIRDMPDADLGNALINMDDAFIGTEPLRELIIREGLRRRDAGVLGEAAGLGSDRIAAESFHRRGKVAEARSIASGLEPLPRGFALLIMRLDGIAVPTEDLAISLEDSPAELALAALLAAERREWDRAERSVSTLRATAADTTLDGRAVGRREGIARGLDAYIEWRRTGTDAATRALQDAQASFSGFGLTAVVNGVMRRAAEHALTNERRPAAALRYALSHRADPYAVFRAAQLYEELGQTRAAVAAYTAVLSVWEEADADLPHAETARQRLAALTTEQS